MAVNNTSLSVGRFSSSNIRKSFFFFYWVDILPYFIGFSSVLYNKELLKPINWLIKDKDNF